MTQVMRQRIEKGTASPFQESTEEIFGTKAGSQTYEKPSQA